MSQTPATTNTTGRVRLPLRQATSEPAGTVFRGLARVVHGLLSVSSRRTWYNSDKLPRGGGVVVVSNHMSYMDALVLGEYMIWSGRWPRYLGKAELWKVPLIGWLARSAGQIPVQRGSSRAGEALVAAEAALHEGKAVVIFPEGTETRDPDLWPMTGRSGAARLALQGGWPVIPIAQWGANDLMPGPKPTWPRLFPPKKTAVICGDPVDLDDLRPHLGTEQERDAVRAATDRIMDDLTALLAQVRDETPPPGRWHMASSTRVSSRPSLAAQQAAAEADARAAEELSAPDATVNPDPSDRSL